jgi:F0F1-type ATP synthase assembly protein I
MENDSGQNDKKKQLNTYAKISSAVIQMAVVITLGAYFGQWLDENQAHHTPVWTIVFSLLGIALGLYLVIREILKIK